MTRGGSAKYVFLLPAIVWVFAFVIYPLIDSLGLSFFTYKLGQGRQDFVGFKNYVTALTSSDLHYSFYITIVYVIVTVLIEIIIGTALAWLVSKDLRYRDSFRTLYTLPIFATPVAVGYLGVTIFNELGGLANGVLGNVGIQVAWLSTTEGALVAAVLLDVWRWTPFVFVIMLAGFQSIPQDMYDQAALHTNSDIKFLRYVAIPLVRASLAVAIIGRVIRAFKVFGLPMALTGGGPGRSTVFFNHYTYKVAMKFFNFGVGSAQAYLFLIFVVVVVALLYRLSRGQMGAGRGS